MVNLMDRIGWEKFISNMFIGYTYNSQDISNKDITITNFNDKMIKIVIHYKDQQQGPKEYYDLGTGETVNINIDDNSYLYAIFGTPDNGWNEINIHEITNVNIFEGELSEDELPENRMNGMRNAFDKYQTSEGKYRVEMVVSNSPIQFGKAGRK
jgi:hypothetical protein